MIGFLLIVIVILICIICLQYKRGRDRDENLKYIQKKLKSIIENKSTERLLVVTDDKELIPFLIEINNILDFNHKMLVDHARNEEAMKKMLSNISHDLKTPLTVVLGYIETLQHKKDIDNEEKHILLKKVHEKTLEVLDLINKFFHLAKLESGDKEISLTRINLNEVSTKNILCFYDVLTDKGLEVKIEIPKDNIYALGNEEALDRILNNLITNAINYGSDGKVIGLTLKEDEKFGYIEVWDRGKGINELNKERVFERMFTLEDSRNKNYQGSGLGLTITKRLVEKLQGEILLNSKPYEKTVFTIKLRKINY